jgi:hypothetical protein
MLVDSAKSRLILLLPEQGSKLLTSKRCSLETPERRTSIRARRVCVGYQKERVFILGPGTAYQGRKSFKANPPIGVGKELSIRKGIDGTMQQRIKCDGSGRTLSPAPIAKIRRVSPNSAYREQILSDFIACSLLTIYGGSVGEGRNRSWLTSLPMLPDYTKALEASIFEIATAKLGRVSENEVLIRESLKFYVNGLWEPQKALWDPKLMYKDDTSAACMALIMYEVAECPDKTFMAWATHMKGCAKMSELMGPDVYGSNLAAHKLFLYFRVIEVGRFLLDPRLNIVSNPMSQDPASFRATSPHFSFRFGMDSPTVHLPFKDRPKCVFHQLLDVAVIAPDITADGCRMLKGPLEGAATFDPTVILLTILGLIDRCWNVDL